jgi:hypothetical protein
MQWCESRDRLCGAAERLVIERVRVDSLPPTSMVYRGMPGIAIENVDGGCVREVLVRDVEIRGHAHRVVHSRGAPQTVRGPRAAGADCAGEGRARVVRERSRAWDTDRLSIRGRPGGRIEDVVLSNVWIEVEGGRGVQVSPLHLPLRIGDDPESLMWGELPAWGVYLRYVRGIRFFLDCEVRTQAPDGRPAVVVGEDAHAEFSGLGENGRPAAPFQVLRAIAK